MVTCGSQSSIACYDLSNKNSNSRDIAKAAESLENLCCNHLISLPVSKICKTTNVQQVILNVSCSVNI